MLHVTFRSGRTDTYPPRAVLKPTRLCECPCCAIACDRCSENEACAHSEHGAGGMCVQYCEPGSFVYQLIGTRAREVVSIEPPLYTEEEQFNGTHITVYRLKEADIPEGFDLTDWRVVDGVYRCLGYYDKAPREVKECVHLTQESCTCVQKSLSIRGRPADTLKRKRVHRALLN